MCSRSNDFDNKPYSNALIKSSQKLRERSMSPSVALPVVPEKLLILTANQTLTNPNVLFRPTVYKSNVDFYRGKVFGYKTFRFQRFLVKVKSVYEKEPMFKDFVRNIPLSESNLYDNNNLSRIKRRFNSMLLNKWGRDQTPDPLAPSRVRKRNN